MIICSDAIEGLRQLTDASIQCCLTSPPYFNLRDYGIPGQIGLEESPEKYIERLVDVFAEVHRILHDSGTLWIVIGDSYAGSGKGYNINPVKQSTNRGTLRGVPMYKDNQTKPKDLIGIPWLLSFALRTVGWCWRQVIVWNKPNPMPESVKDRCTTSHEYILLFSKSNRYHFNSAAISEPGIFGVPNAPDKIKSPYGQGYKRRADKQRGHSRRHAGFNERWDQKEKEQQCSGKRNKRSVWTISPEPYNEAHFATFPTKLVEPCILAGCPEGGAVLDPFCGSGTVGVVAFGLGRKFFGIDINPSYCEMAERRIQSAFPLLVNS